MGAVVKSKSGRAFLTLADCEIANPSAVILLMCHVRKRSGTYQLPIPDILTGKSCLVAELQAAEAANPA